MADPATDSGRDDASVDAFLNSRGTVQPTMADAAPPTDAPMKAGGGNLMAMPKFPEPPKLHDIKAMERQEIKDPMQAFGGPAMFLAALAGLATRRPMKVALDSATAIINGDIKGQQEKQKLARENWQAATETAIAQNKIEMDRYRAVMEKYEHDVNQQMAHMMALSSGFGNPIIQAAAASGNPQMVWNVIKDTEAQATKLKEVHQKDQQLDLQRKEAEERARHNKAMEGEGANDEETARAIAEYRMPPPSANNRSPRVQAIREKVLELNPQYDETQYAAKRTGATAEARTGGTTSANLDIIMRNAHAAIPQAIEMSEKVPRGSWVPLNKLMQTAEASISDPALKQFKLANLQLAELWARAMNPRGVMRESDRALALDMLSTADSPETYRKVTESLRTFLERERQSVKEFRQGVEPGGGKADGAPNVDEFTRKAKAAGYTDEQIKEFTRKAKAAGYTDEQIKEFISKKAKAAGYTDEQIKE